MLCSYIPVRSRSIKTPLSRGGPTDNDQLISTCDQQILADTESLKSCRSRSAGTSLISCVGLAFVKK